MMQNTPATPTQLGVRPAPALVQQLLVGAFGWMFAGLLLFSLRISRCPLSANSGHSRHVRSCCYCGRARRFAERVCSAALAT